MVTSCAPAPVNTADGDGTDEPSVIKGNGSEIDPGKPVDIDVFIPSKEDLERKMREAREEFERHEREKNKIKPPVAGTIPIDEPKTVTPDIVVKPTVRPIDQVVTPDVVQLPDRGVLQTRRPLDPKLIALLQHLENNDISAASRELKRLDVNKLVPQDRFLLQGLQAYIYFRLGRDETALELIGKLHRDLEITMPLKISQLKVVAGPLRAIRFGKYREIENPTYRQGSILYLYLQPDNYVQLRDGDMWKVSLEVDFTLKDSRGNVINRMQMVSGNAFEKVCNDVLGNDRNRNRREDIYYAFGVPIPKRLNPMEYTLEVVLRDRNTKPRKETRSSVTFTLE